MRVRTCAYVCVRVRVRALGGPLFIYSVIRTFIIHTYIHHSHTHHSLRVHVRYGTVVHDESVAKPPPQRRQVFHVASGVEGAVLAEQAGRDHAVRVQQVQQGVGVPMMPYTYVRTVRTYTHTHTHTRTHARAHIVTLNAWADTNTLPLCQPHVKVGNERYVLECSQTASPSSSPDIHNTTTVNTTTATTTAIHSPLIHPFPHPSPSTCAHTQTHAYVHTHNIITSKTPCSSLTQ